MKWPIMRLLTRNILPFVALLFAAAVVAVTALVFVISLWKPITLSGWHVASSQLARWFLFGLGIYLVHNVLPIAVSHGRTRREVFGQATVYSLILSGVAALCVAIGYGLETLLYQGTGWTQGLGGRNQMFESTTEFGTIFVAYWAMFAVWTAVGAFVAAGFDRLGHGGLITIVVGLGLIFPAGMAVGGANALPFAGALSGTMSAPMPVTLLLCVASYVVAFGLAWTLVRDMPVRIRAA